MTISTNKIIDCISTGSRSLKEVSDCTGLSESALLVMMHQLCRLRQLSTYIEGTTIKYRLYAPETKPKKVAAIKPRRNLKARAQLREYIAQSGKTGVTMDDITHNLRTCRNNAWAIISGLSKRGEVTKKREGRKSRYFAVIA